VALVPAGVFTVTSTVPAVVPTAVATISDEETTLKGAEDVPNHTIVAASRFVPVMVTEVDGSGACSLLKYPLDGDTEVTVGAAAAAPAGGAANKNAVPTATRRSHRVLQGWVRRPDCIFIPSIQSYFSVEST
jgi:hypothetical protein